MILALIMAAATVQQSIADYASCLGHKTSNLALDHGNPPGEIATAAEAQCLGEWNEVIRTYVRTGTDAIKAEAMRRRFRSASIVQAMDVRKASGDNPMGWR